MDRRILPAAGVIPSNASPPSHSGQPYSGHPLNEDDASTKNSGRPGPGIKRRTKKEGETEGGDDEESPKKKKSKRRKVDHACVYCR